MLRFEITPIHFSPFTIHYSLFSLPAASNDAATNMAIDMALLETVPKATAIFRHYRWATPTVTFGYAQRINEVKTIVTDDVQLCRRPTGGGIVDHRNDWTYSLVLHSNLKAAQIPATELYAGIHQCLQQTLAAQTIETQLAPCPRGCEQPHLKSQISNFKPPGPSQCFTLPVANDVIHPNGQKIAGAAIKRTRQGLLIQGSIDRASLPDTFNFQRLSKALAHALAKRFNLELKTSVSYPHLPDEQRIEQARQRFESETWTKRR